MTVWVAGFAGEFAALSAWTGEPEDELRRDEGYHDAGREHWVAWDGQQVAGVLHPWRAPDGRQRLYFGRCRADAYGPLAGKVRGECYVQVDVGDEAALEALRAAGFADLRAEHEYTVPVRRLGAAVPAGLRVITADQTELEPLMLLDCAIRADIPGADGWQPDPVWFREETYDSPFFDPLTYRVALDGDRYVGLARVWRPVPERDPMPVLGCVGVLAAYRQRGLARALIGAAFEPLAERRVPAVNAEVDTANAASNALFGSLGASVTGGTIELRRG